MYVNVNVNNLLYVCVYVCMYVSLHITYCLIYWASRRAQLTSSCLGSDLNLWNMHKRGRFGGDFGGVIRPQPSAETDTDSTPALFANVKAH